VNRWHMGIAVIGCLLSLLTHAQQDLQPIAPAPQNVDEEFIVTGRLPGPPLWKVSNGDNTLWIFATLSPIPKGMEWDSTRAERVLAKAQEYLEPPSARVTVSPLVRYNPINLVRGYRLAKRLSANDDKQRLEEVLPAQLYQRYLVLKNQYAAKDKDLDALRPLAASDRLEDQVFDQEGLVRGGAITRKIDKLVNKNSKLKKTETRVKMKLEGGYGDLAERVETLVASIPPEKEVACFESELVRLETDLVAIKSRAATWAQGYVDEFRDINLQQPEETPCFEMLLATSEGTTITELQAQSDQRWLTAAEAALANNSSTFAVLNITELLTPSGLLEKLRAKGYGIEEP
jgi:TraB/PrgY/gumN family